MFDLLALAFQADLTRVFTFMLSRESSQRTFPEIGVNDPWHVVSHHGEVPEKVARAAKMGVSDPNKVYTMNEMARGETLFAATGVTDGNMLSGVRFGRHDIQTHTIVMRSSSGTVREIKARHQDMDKF